MNFLLFALNYYFTIQVMLIIPVLHFLKIIPIN